MFLKFLVLFMLKCAFPQIFSLHKLLCLRSKARIIAEHVLKVWEEEVMKAVLTAPYSQYRYKGRIEGRLWKQQAKGAQVFDQHRELAR